MEAFSAKWFTLYYLVLGLITGIYGFYLLVAYEKAQQYLTSQAHHDYPPALLRKILKYFFLFTLACLLLSFFPFSWIELLFSFWSLIMVYIAGIQLVRWKQTREMILGQPHKVENFVRMTGATMVAVGLVILALSYLVIKSTNVL